jgi:hypothetical protein
MSLVCVEQTPWRVWHALSPRSGGTVPAADFHVEQRVVKHGLHIDDFRCVPAADVHDVHVEPSGVRNHVAHVFDIQGFPAFVERCGVRKHVAHVCDLRGVHFADVRVEIAVLKHVAHVCDFRGFPAADVPLLNGVSSNMWLMLVTFEVSQSLMSALNSKSFANIPLMSVTFEVSQILIAPYFEPSRDTRSCGVACC